MGKDGSTKAFATAVLKESPDAFNKALAECLAVWLTCAEVQQRLRGLGKASKRSSRRSSQLWLLKGDGYRSDWTF